MAGRIKKAILHTQGMFEEMKGDKDYPLWKEIAELMNGEEVLVIRSAFKAEEYVFLGLVNKEKNKEVFYKAEQDRVVGMYIHDREEFDRAWDSGNYEPDGVMCIEEKFVKIINKAEI